MLVWGTIVCNTLSACMSIALDMASAKLDASIYSAKYFSVKLRHIDTDFDKKIPAKWFRNCYTYYN